MNVQNRPSGNKTGLKQRINRILKNSSGVKRDAAGKFTSGSGGLKSLKTFNWRRALPVIIAVSLVGGYTIYRSFAATTLAVPSEFVARSYTEGLGRLPTQDEWNVWQAYIPQKGCNKTTVSILLSRVYDSEEFRQLPYDNGARLTAMYRGVLTREPDASGFAYWKGQMDKGKSTDDVLSAFVSSSEFQRVVSQVCSTVNYPLKGEPFALTKSTSGDTLQKRIDAAKAGDTIWLDKSELVTLSNALLIKRDVTLATRGSSGIAGRKAYVNMARIAVASATTTPSPVVLMPGAKLENVWVDGRMWQKGTKDGGKNNIRIYPTAKESRVENVRSENTTGAQNIMAFGIAGSEYAASTNPDYKSDGVCSGSPVITGNLVINSANLHESSKWSDGIATSCHNTVVSNNQVLDPSDVGIIAYRTYGAFAQKSQIFDNQILSAGNIAFGGLVADPLSIKGSQEGQAYPSCMTHETDRQPNCDFTGLSFRSNIIWSGQDTHFVFGASVGTRAWGFFNGESRGGPETGSGAQFINNNSGTSTVNVVVPLYVSGMRNAQVKNNFISSKVTNATKTTTKCVASKLQLYNPSYSQGIVTSNTTSTKSLTDPKYITAVSGNESRDSCI